MARRGQQAASMVCVGATVFVFSSIILLSLTRAVEAVSNFIEAANFVVFTPADADEVTEALLSAGPMQVNVDWHGRVQLLRTLVLGNGSCLTITGLDDAVIDGGGTIPLLTVSDGAKLSLDNVSLEKGFADDWGGAITAHESSLVFSGCIFSSNTATNGGGEFNECCFIARLPRYVIGAYLNRKTKMWADMSKNNVKANRHSENLR